MIRINLLERKSSSQLPVIAGIDLNEIPIKLVVIAWLITFIPDMVVKDMWTAEIKREQEINKKLELEVKNLKKKAEGIGDIKAKIDEFQDEERILNQRLEVAKGVLKLKKNPWKIFHYISLNIPDKVWLNNVSIKNDLLLLEGESVTYKHIGVFLENLQGAVFFANGQPTLVDFKTIQNKDSGIRTEYFKIQGRIKSYN